MQPSSTRFALIGAGGYIAPRHMKAIKNTGNTLVAALDPNDSVGIIDSYFPDAHFFTEFERFDRHIDKLRRAGAEQAVQYVSICSPNYLHDSHIRFALRAGADAICEKPIVLNPWNIDALQELERDTGRRVRTILQLRVHPAITALRGQIRAARSDKKHDVTLTYITPRGRWYFQSWKGEEKKSGGLTTNIGVHFFDMLYFVFGEVQSVVVHAKSESHAAGYLELENARVRWFISLNGDDVPPDIQANGQRAYRSMTVDGEAVEFSDGFADLHTQLYADILSGSGFCLEDNRAAIETVANIRTAPCQPLTGDYHPMLKSKKRAGAV